MFKNVDEVPTVIKGLEYIIRYLSNHLFNNLSNHIYLISHMHSGEGCNQMVLHGSLSMIERFEIYTIIYIYKYLASKQSHYFLSIYTSVYRVHKHYYKTERYGEEVELLLLRIMLKLVDCNVTRDAVLHRSVCHYLSLYLISLSLLLTTIYLYVVGANF